MSKTTKNASIGTVPSENKSETLLLRKNARAGKSEDMNRSRIFNIRTNCWRI
jgi:hypothetical protein